MIADSTTDTNKCDQVNMSVYINTQKEYCANGKVQIIEIQVSFLGLTTRAAGYYFGCK
jgi:hypothetical protein